MNFDYSDDQKYLKQEARKFLQVRCPIATTRRILDDDRTSFDRELWHRVAEMGWTGAAIPERWGGVGLGRIELCAIAEELGRVIAPIPFASTVYIFAEAILTFGNDAQREALLPSVASGDVIGCLATNEREGPIMPEAMDTRVVTGKISGTKVPVTDGDIATYAIVAAQDEAGPGLFIVHLDGEGITRETIRTLDPTRSAARMQFKDTPCERLGAAGEGATLLAAILDRAAALFAFEQLGGADRCLEAARSYAMERYAFGRAIGSYQAIKHKLADMYIKNEIARSSAYYGAWALNTDAAELPEAASAARIACTQAYDFAAKEHLHTHGGIGFTWEMDCHLHLRRSRQLGLALGGLPFWRERLMRSLERHNAA
ncbi:acyl-CoA dehydrogenase domain protein [Parvibaculum lavamentivorans DS-1]|uniref:Acyl-CoA dehydrogenase domain protein n=1 Tax=Parvibaculum lavamentivorans (strain DS-1 / DSM 13023 / NCIMB 13966) TaxID=402881 RepID=A7HRX0_PARL1|nr:acyl-CoA dehydrogenase family protein [Parvibaculum lavamentivorans]ABS62653.1 acyl-CoA dehydrogenase domain protein [Parvibaculum lavamentivorans DS-1]